jgi:hypothetical protein
VYDGARPPTHRTAWDRLNWRIILPLIKNVIEANAKLIMKSRGITGQANINVHMAPSPADGSCFAPKTQGDYPQNNDRQIDRRYGERRYGQCPPQER